MYRGMKTNIKISMTNKRKIALNVFKMRSLAPVKVSPLIKTLRWTFLLCGIFYGVQRLNYLRAYEETEAPRRKAQLQAKLDKLKAQANENTKNDVILLGKEFEVVDFPPGWEQNLF